MTATPIPRTLALAGYGDLDVDRAARAAARAAGRSRRTSCAGERERARAYERIREELRAGRQAFVVCPLVEESEALQARAATAEFERLRDGELARLPRRAAARPDAPAREAGGDGARSPPASADVLVATTVIEVGIDVPNATVMLVEDAERYGISQLHQLRGRVGRGEHASLCLLFGPARVARGCRRSPQHRDGFRAGRDRPRAARRGRADRHAPVRPARVPRRRLPEDAELLERARAVRARRSLDADPELAAPEHALLADALRAALRRRRPRRPIPA